MSNSFIEQLQNLTTRFPFAAKLFKASSCAIGIDVGSKFIKKVRLSKEPKGLKLVEAVSLPLPAPGLAGQAGAGSQTEEKAKTIQDLLAGVKPSTVSLTTAVSGQQSVLRSVIFPKMTREEFTAALVFEAEKHIPFKLDEVFLDFHILGERPGGRMEVLLAAARKDLVDSHLEFFKAAGLVPGVVDLEAVALANAWEVSPAGQDKEAAALVHIGAKGTIINFFLGKQLQFSREIPFGGDLFTQAVGEAFTAEAGRAEELKCNPGDSAAQVRTILQPKWEGWLTQCRTSFDFYENQFGQGVKRLVLSGGSAAMEGFSAWIQEASGIPTELWNPVAGLTSEVDPDKLKAFGISLGVAVGLAIRGFQG